MANDCKVQVCSHADDRTSPLFATYCGDDGALERFMTNVFFCDSTTGACLLSCAPMEFMRLGKESRALVMSFYRAIVERLGIMRARGDCAVRPADFVCSLLQDIFSEQTPPTMEELAGDYRRRTFGGEFRATYNSLLRKYRDSMEPQVSGSAQLGTKTTLFPPTQQVCGASCTFIPGAVAMDDSSTLEWKHPSSVCYINKLKNGCGGFATWLADFANRADGFCSKYFEQAAAPWANRRGIFPIARAFWKCYSGAGFTRDSNCLKNMICAVMSQGGQSLPKNRLETYSWLTNDNSCAMVGIGRAFMKECVGGSMSDVPQPVPQTFNLPALALALRLLSVWNAQTVQRCFALSIPHRFVSARRSLGFGSHLFCVCVASAETCSITLCTRYLDHVEMKGSKSYQAGSASSDLYVIGFRLEDRQPPSPLPPCDIIPPSCWMLWTSKAVSGQTGRHTDAVATYCALYPLYNKASQSARFVTFGGPAYPANWAVREGDVSFGAVSGFVKAYLINPQTGNPMDRAAWLANYRNGSGVESALGSHDDLMDVLSDQIVAAAIRKFETCEKNHLRGGPATFAGLCFPTTESAVWNEITGAAPDISDLRQQAAAASSGAAVVTNNWSSIWRDRGAWYGYNLASSSCQPITPVTDAEGTWLPLATQGNGAAVGYSYDEANCEGHPKIRWPWNLDFATMQFGGFFGSFIFNNRSVRQS